jgi:hypothetical protein
VAKPAWGLDIGSAAALGFGFGADRLGGGAGFFAAGLGAAVSASGEEFDASLEPAAPLAEGGVLAGVFAASGVAAALLAAGLAPEEESAAGCVAGSVVGSVAAGGAIGGVAGALVVFEAGAAVELLSGVSESWAATGGFFAVKPSNGNP